jgi:outer membrane receptor protein involved in Fe transport
VSSTLSSELDFQERDLLVDLGYLAGDSLAFSVRYRLGFAEYEETFPTLPADQHLVENSAVLHEARFNVLFNPPFAPFFKRSFPSHRGFFSQFEAIWRSQSNYDYAPDLPGDDVWQFNVYAGFRWPRRAADLTFGVLNLTDQDYRFNPLNLHRDLPRERTFVVSLRFNLEHGL